MDDLDKAFAELVDGTVDNTVESRLEKIKPILAKHGLSIIKIQPATPAQQKQRPSSSREPAEFQMALDELASLLDVTAAHFVKTYQDSTFLFKPRITKTTRQTLGFFIDTISNIIVAAQNDGGRMGTKKYLDEISGFKQLLDINGQKMQKYTIHGNKILWEVNIARAHLAQVEARAFRIKSTFENPESQELLTLIDELYNLCVVLQRYYELNV